MKVALVSPYAWDRPGGVQSHIRALASVLRERDHETLVIAPTVARPEGIEDGVERAGHAVGIPANGSVAPIAFGPVASAALRRAVRSFAPDVIHIHEPLVPSLSLLALWNRFDAPLVGTFHAAADQSTGYRIARPVLKRAIERLTVRTTVSAAARDLVSRYFPGDYETTPNGVEIKRFATAEPLDLGPGRKVLFLSRLERRKGLTTLIQAMTRLGEIDARLVVAGEGPGLKEAVSLTKSLGIDVRFVGSLSEGDIPRAYRAADVYCAPGLGGESFGIVLVEAMAAGVPVVCSDLPGFRAVVGPAGLLTPPGDAGALAEALRSALTDRRAAMAAASVERAHAFDWSSLVVGVEDIYRKALRVG